MRSAVYALLMAGAARSYNLFEQAHELEKELYEGFEHFLHPVKITHKNKRFVE